MRVGIQSWGSEGDLRPLVALAGRLRKLGHAPDLVFTVVDEMDYAPLCLRFGVTMRVVPEESVTIDAIVRDLPKAGPTKILEAVIARAFRPYVDAMYEAGRELCKKSDVVVGSSSSWPLKVAALSLGVPYAVVDYMPVVPSRVVPPTGLANWGPLNGLRWLVLNRMLDMAFLRDPAALFEKAGLPKPKHAVPDVVHSGVLDLHAASPTLCPRAPDWGASHVVCGDIVVDERDEPWTPSPALAEFLDTGPPPVLMSLGSMEHMAPERARDLLVASARAAKVRTIIQTKRERKEGRDGDLFFAPWIPHRHLLPRCAAVLHHGGAGTTHAVARAGLPSVVLPFIMEQNLWGRRLAQLGAATPPRSFWKASPEHVARDVQRAVGMKAAAAKLAASMALEPSGVAVAAEALTTRRDAPRPQPAR